MYSLQNVMSAWARPADFLRYIVDPKILKKSFISFTKLPLSYRLGEDDSDLDKDLNRNMFQAFYGIFMFHCL